MNRHYWILMTVCLGLGGCAAESGDPTDEVGEGAAALGAEGHSVRPPEQGAGAGKVGKPSDLLAAESGDPSGPTPYPWRTDDDGDDPSGGPTPYPWDDEDEADPTDSTPTNGTTSSSSAGATQNTKSTN